jgi:hypothetical protein
MTWVLGILIFTLLVIVPAAVMWWDLRKGETDGGSVLADSPREDQPGE